MCDVVCLGGGGFGCWVGVCWRGCVCEIVWCVCCVCVVWCVCVCCMVCVLCVCVLCGVCVCACVCVCVCECVCVLLVHILRRWLYTASRSRTLPAQFPAFRLIGKMY